METKNTQTVDTYIKGFTPNIREILEEIRKMLHKTIPGMEEKISYGVPTLTINDKYVIYFAGYKKHVSIYPVPNGNMAYKKKIKEHQKGKGTLQFPLDKPIPYELIKETAQLLAKARSVNYALKK